MGAREKYQRIWVKCVWDSDIKGRHFATSSYIAVETGSASSEANADLFENRSPAQKNQRSQFGSPLGRVNGKHFTLWSAVLMLLRPQSR